MHSSVKKIKGKKSKNSYDLIYLTEECINYNCWGVRGALRASMG